MQDHFPKRISELRKQKGLSMRALGKTCGVAHTTISAYECGVMPRLDTAIRLSSALGVSLDYLFGRSQKRGVPANGNQELFSERLRDLRTGRGLSQVVLSELCGLGSNQGYRWEHCGNVPNIEDVARLADFFSVSLDYLCGCSDKKGG